MRILDQANNEVEFDEKLGYLVEDKVFVRHHNAVKGKEEVSHYVVVKEYSNGGKEVEKVIDVPAVLPQAAYDEYEDIMRFVPYTQEELNAIRIAELKQLLADSDYIILKLAEGATTKEKCASTIKKRAEWREEMNRLERGNVDG